MVTLQFEKGRSEQRYGAFLNLPADTTRGAHSFAHNWFSSDARSLDMIHLWRAEQYAKLVQMLKSHPDADGKTLLDNCALVKTLEVSTGIHGYTDIPIVLAGRCGGAFQPGRYLDYTGTGRKPTASLWLSLAHAMGVPLTVFPSDGKGFRSTGTLPGLLT